MQDQKWVIRIILALLIIAALIAATLFAQGVNPFSKQAADIVLKSADTVLSDSSQRLWDASILTTEESEQAVSGETGTPATASGTKTSSQDKKAAKNEQKEEKQEQKAVFKTSETIQTDMDSVIYRIAGLLPDWIPGRPYVVTFSILAVLVLILWLLNRYF